MSDQAQAIEGEIIEGATESTATALEVGIVQPLAERMPEEFRAFGEDNSFDVEKSTDNLLSKYESLSKQLEGFEAPPESADGYEFNAENLQLEDGQEFDAKAFMSDEKNKSFLKKAHAHGMNNKQVQMVLEHALIEFGPDIMGGHEANTADAAIEALKSNVWTNPQDYTVNMQAANRAFNSFPDQLKQDINKRLGNDPTFIQAMAVVGKEMAEDTPPAEVLDSMQDDIDKLMRSEAYHNSEHEDHAAVSKKIQAYYQSKFQKRA